MSLYQPTNIYPDLIGGDENGTIYNYGDGPDFELPIRWRVNGNSTLVAYQIDFYANSATATATSTTGKITLATPFSGTDATGNVQEFQCFVPYKYFALPAATSGYEGKFCITQWWGSAGSNERVVQRSLSVYRIQRPGEISIVSGPTGSSGNYSFTGAWTTPEPNHFNLSLSWTRWTLEQRISGVYVTVQDTGRVWGSSSYVWTPEQIAPGDYMVTFTAQDSLGRSLSAEPVQFSVMQNYLTVSGIISAVCDKSLGAVRVSLNNAVNLSRGVLGNNLQFYTATGNLVVPSGESVAWTEPQFDSSWEGWSFAWNGKINSVQFGVSSNVFSISQGNGQTMSLGFAPGSVEDSGAFVLSVQNGAAVNNYRFPEEQNATDEHLFVLFKAGNSYLAYVWRYSGGSSKTYVGTVAPDGFSQSRLTGFTIYGGTTTQFSSFSKDDSDPAYYNAATTGDKTGIPKSGDLSMLNWSSTDFSPYESEDALVLPGRTKATWPVQDAVSNSPVSFEFRFTLNSKETTQIVFSISMSNGNTISLFVGQGSLANSFAFSSGTGAGGLTILSNVRPENGAEYDAIITHGVTAETQNSYVFYLWKRISGTSVSEQIQLTDYGGNRVTSLTIGGATSTDFCFLSFGANEKIYEWAQSGTFTGIDSSNPFIRFSASGDSVLVGNFATDGTIFRTESGKPPVRFARYSIADSTNKVEFYDYSAGNGKTYTYSVFFQGNENAYPVVAESEAIVPCFWEWTLIEAVSPTEVNAYRIRMNVGSGTDGNGASPGIFQTFTPYPIVMQDTQNRHSGTLTGLIGRLTAPGVYEDSIDVRDKIRGLSVSNHPLYLRNRKGDFWRIAISGEISTSVNDNSYKQEVTVSIPWVEIESADEPVYLDATTFSESSGGGINV